jgi:ferredoxin
MVTEISDGLKSWGVPEDDIKFESFGFSKTKKRRLAPSSGNRAAQVLTPKISRGRLAMTPFKSLGTVKWSMVWAKPKKNSEAERRNGVPADRENFLGWLVVSQRPGWRAVASFSASGRFLRGSLSPKNEMTAPLRNLLSELVGKEIETAVRILQGYMKRERKKAEALDVPIWLELFKAFPAVKAGGASRSATSLSSLSGKSEAEDRVTVVFSKSKKILKWDSSSGSLLEFAHRNGVSIEAGCRSGNCGTCVTAMKKGNVTYLQAPGTDPQEGSCLTCISVPKENLTLYA